MDPATQEKLEAAAFRKLIDHLRQRTDVQNIDLMNLAGFCRNCLSRWYGEAASEAGLDMDKAAARHHIYGMDYDEWTRLYRTEASPEQQQQFADAIKAHKPD